MVDADVSFSDLIEHSGGNVQWSPNGQLLAAAKSNKLTLRSVETLEVRVCNFEVLDSHLVIVDHATFWMRREN